MSCTYWLSGRAGRQIQNKIDPRQVLWARETEQPAGQENIWAKVRHGTWNEHREVSATMTEGQLFSRPPEPNSINK